MPISRVPVAAVTPFDHNRATGSQPQTCTLRAWLVTMPSGLAAGRTRHPGSGSTRRGPAACSARHERERRAAVAAGHRDQDPGDVDRQVAAGRADRNLQVLRQRQAGPDAGLGRAEREHDDRPGGASSTRATHGRPHITCVVELSTRTGSRWCRGTPPGRSSRRAVADVGDVERVGAGRLAVHDDLEHAGRRWAGRRRTAPPAGSAAGTRSAPPSPVAGSVSSWRGSTTVSSAPRFGEVDAEGDSGTGSVDMRISQSTSLAAAAAAPSMRNATSVIVTGPLNKHRVVQRTGRASACCDRTARWCCCGAFWRRATPAPARATARTANRPTQQTGATGARWTMASAASTAPTAA
jgi:hypothetical protein